MTEIRDESLSPAGAFSRLALGDVASTVGLGRIQMLAWRDRDDPEAGGSEIHASEIASRWAAAGIEVSLRTSRVAGLPARARRMGYAVERRSGRYRLFPAVALQGLTGRLPPHDALVEVWNGMPFFSPVWSSKPKVVFLHHVHKEMWDLVLSRRLARLGWFLEGTVAPRLYRSTPIVTLSSSSRDEIVELLGIPSANVTVVPPGIHSRFSPGGSHSPDPLVVAVGRLVPVKRFDLLIDVLAALKRRHPRLRAVIAGEGYERPALEEHARRLGATGWLELPGRLPDHEIVALYRRAWVVASTSLREGWGMTLTEAGACGTPAVATDIAGHSDAVIHGRTGLLARDLDELGAHLDALICDRDLRAKLSDGALRHAERFTWEATARGTLEALAVAVAEHR